MRQKIQELGLEGFVRAYVRTPSIKKVLIKFVQITCETMSTEEYESLVLQVCEMFEIDY